MSLDCGRKSEQAKSRTASHCVYYLGTVRKKTWGLIYEQTFLTLQIWSEGWLTRPIPGASLGQSQGCMKKLKKALTRLSPILMCHFVSARGALQTATHLILLTKSKCLPNVWVQICPSAAMHIGIVKRVLTVCLPHKHNFGESCNERKQSKTFTSVWRP